MKEIDEIDFEEKPKKETETEKEGQKQQPPFCQITFNDNKSIGGFLVGETNDGKAFVLKTNEIPALIVFKSSIKFMALLNTKQKAEEKEDE